VGNRFGLLWLPLVPGFFLSFYQRNLKGNCRAEGMAVVIATEESVDGPAGRVVIFLFLALFNFYDGRIKAADFGTKKKDVPVAPLWFVIVATAVAAVDSNRRPSDSRVA
jgi:hypothetical protein